MNWYLLLPSPELCDVAARLGGIHGTDPSALLLLLFLCMLEGAPGTLPPLFLPPAREERAAHGGTGRMVQAHGRRCSGCSGWGDAGGSGLGWRGAGWLQGEGPHTLSSFLSSCCKRCFQSRKRKWRTSGLKFWRGVVGSHSQEQIWPEV